MPQISPTTQLVAALAMDVDCPSQGKSGKVANAKRKKPKTGPAFSMPAVCKASMPAFVAMNADPQQAEFKIMTAFQKTIPLQGFIDLVERDLSLETS